MVLNAREGHDKLHRTDAEDVANVPPPRGDQMLLEGLQKELGQHHRRANDLETAAKGLITAVFAVRWVGQGDGIGLERLLSHAPRPLGSVLPT